MAMPRTLAGMWSDINKRFFAGVLPTSREISIRWVADNAVGAHLDGRHERASTLLENGKWSVEVNEGLRGFPPAAYLAVAHEAIHVKIGPDKDHRSAEWRAEVRRLSGAGLLGRVL